MSWESWEDHKNRLEAERAKAAAENLCPQEVNEWAAYQSYQKAKHKICMRKLSDEAVQLGHNVCGMHFRQVRKEEAEAQKLREYREEQRRANEQHKLEQEAKDAQEAAILAELERHGVTQAELQKPWRYDRVKRGWTVNVPLSVLWKVIDVLPMIDPDEAVEVFKQLQQAELEAAKPKGEEAPF
jgi:hypothetical protein